VRKDVVPSELAVQMNAMMLQALFASGFFIVLLKLGSQTSVMLRSSAQCTSYVAVITSFAIANVLAWVNLPSKKRECCILISILLLNAALALNAAMNDASPVARVKQMNFHYVAWKVVPLLGYMRKKYIMVALGWSCAMDILSHWLAQFKHGDPFNTSTVLWFVGSSAIYNFFGFFFTQARLEALPNNEEVVKSHCASLEKLLSMLCDGIAWIADDDETTVIKTTGHRELFTTGAAGPYKLSDLLADNVDEVHRLQKAFHRSKKSLVHFHSTCSSSYGEPFRMHFFIVRQENLFSLEQVSCPSRCHGFLVGVRKQKILACHTGDCNSDAAIEGSNIASDASFPNSQIAATPPVRSRLDEQESEQFTPRSTKSGELFGSMEDMGNTAENMKRLMKLSHEEHWLVKPHALNVDPSHHLGHGSFGVVMAGSLHGSDVAIKLPNLRKLRIATRSLFNEIRILRHIRHPNIVLFHGVCIANSNSHLALVFERVHGTSLKSFIETPSPVPSAMQRHCLVLDVCAALRYLHGSDPQVVHGDVKADNIMVDGTIFAKPRAKMLDFGLSRLVNKSVHRLGGTLLWMAPEAIAGSHAHTAADVFSFGRLLSFTMSGQMPYPRMSKRETRIMASSGQTYIMVPPGSFFQAGCESLCAACCAFTPSLRPTMTAVHNMILTWIPSGTEAEAGCAMPRCKQSFKPSSATPTQLLTL